jgi:hypothetical protein
MTVCKTRLVDALTGTRITGNATIQALVCRC